MSLLSFEAFKGAAKKVCPYSPWVKQAQQVACGAMPSPFRELLSHKGILTPSLEAFHRDKITIETIQSKFEGRTFERHVILRCTSNRKIVELGAIQIVWELIPLSLQKKVLEGKLAFGTLLEEAKIPYQTGPRISFSVASSDLPDFLVPPANRIFYGRTHQILNTDGELMAQSSEILW